MKRMKHVVALGLMVMAMMAVQRVRADQATAAYEYKVVDGKAVITKCTGAVGAVVIPARIDGYMVSKIDGFVLGHSGLTSVTIPSSVTNIGENAFYGCSGLTNVSIPSSVTRIGKDAFENCSSLKAIYVEAGDAGRVRGLLEGSGKSCTGIAFVTTNRATSALGGMAQRHGAAATAPTVTPQRTPVVLAGGDDECATTKTRKNAEAFVIPKSLLARMIDAHDHARDRALGVTCDVNELYSMCVHLRMTNASEIVKRPRGEMSLCDDLLSADRRADLWPPEVEAFEATLSAKMAYDEKLGYRGKPEFAEEMCGGTNEDGFVAANPTIRWVNSEIEQWATKSLDKYCERMAATNFCAMSGDEKMPEGTRAWQVADDLYFVIQRCDGAWNLREYMFVLWKHGSDQVVVASFDSFPNRKEAVAAMLIRTDAAAANNLAVLMWRHQCDRTKMHPRLVRGLLEMAVEAGVPTAPANLEILRAHIPEIFAEQD